MNSRMEFAEMVKAKLKPCPFCGSRAQITKSINPGFPKGIYTLECRKCPVGIDRNYTRKKTLLMRGTDGWQMTNDWNIPCILC